MSNPTGLHALHDFPAPWIIRAAKKRLARILDHRHATLRAQSEMAVPSTTVAYMGDQPQVGKVVAFGE